MRILVVEDEKKVASFVKMGLEEESYAVDVSYDGEEGGVLAETNPYDLIILDIMLPKLDGLTLCRRVRAKGDMTPVLLLTARNTLETKVSGFDTGADQFLPKPFAFVELDDLHHETRVSLVVVVRDRQEQPVQTTDLAATQVQFKPGGDACQYSVALLRLSLGLDGTAQTIGQDRP